VNSWYDTDKKLVYIFSRIFHDIPDRFSQSFDHVKALWVQMTDLYLIF